MKLYFQTVALLALLASGSGYQIFQNRIPNGYRVPNPCNLSTIWDGVGHESRYGKGWRNPFGWDFAANNLTWSKKLCQLDSDGDGLTNGQELGDPNCVWTPGATPTSTTNLSHPGICEPLTLTKCTGRNLWLKDCGPGILDCPPIHEQGVINKTIRFESSLVPNVDTTYICRTYLFPNDSDYDIIAVEPVIDNFEVNHHLILYGCIHDERDNYLKNESFICPLDGGHNCPALIGLWATGMQGQCFTNKAGFRIGPHGYQYARLQIHWDNPQLKVGQYDGSGMRIYYTPKLRPDKLMMIMAGQMYLEIPPHLEDITFAGSCTPICTKQNPGNIYIISVFLHEHLVGKSGDISLYRNGSLIQVLQNVTSYDFMMPEQVWFDPPVELRRGDELRVTCHYNSLKMNTTTYYGESTQTEMCLAFVTYYPQIDNYDFCGQWKSLTACGTLDNIMYEKCNFTQFLSDIRSFNASCFRNCENPICCSLITSIYDSCLRYPDARDYLETVMPGTVSALVDCMFPQPGHHTCPANQVVPPACPTNEQVPPTCPTNQPVPPKCPTNQPLPLVDTTNQPLVTKYHDSKSQSAYQSVSFSMRILLCIALILIYR